MKTYSIFNEASRTSRLVGMHPLKIAQRFNAGLRSEESPKSVQGRQNRGCLWALLSSLAGLRHLDHTIFPALKRWAIFGNTDAKYNHLGRDAARRHSMRTCATFNEAFRMFRVVTMNISCGCVSVAALKIAQRFNAGLRLSESPKSRQGRQDRGCLLALLSSLKGLRHFYHTIFPVPQARGRSIFRSTDERERDSLRLAS
jgi:hypothetical protein